MKWFKHSGAALRDPKLQRLIIDFGIEGYGLYFACVEIIAGNLGVENITFELEHDAELLANLFRMDTLKVERIMKRCIELKLFQVNGSGHITCRRLAKYIDSSTSQSPQFKQLVSSTEFQEALGRLGDNRNLKKLEAVDSRLDEIRLDEIKLDKKEKIHSPAFAVDSMPYRMAKLIYDLHLGHDPKFLFGKNLEKTLQRWAKDIDKLNRLDGREWEEIERVIRWCQADGCFWIPNILSGAKLRDKFPVLLGQSTNIRETAEEKRLRLCREEMAKV